MGKHSDVTHAPGLLAPRYLPSPRSQHSGARPPALRGRDGGYVARKREGIRGRPQFIGAFVITVGVMLVNVVDPYSGSVASPYYQIAPKFVQDAQSVLLSGDYVTSSARDGYSVTGRTLEAAASAPAAGTPDPDSAQAIALGIITSFGWGEEQYNCLVSLWNRESRWNVYALNPSSGAYGIPQSLPGDKMASAGADWQTNPVTQINWGLGYIEGRYGSPCGAWAHSEDRGWY